MTIGLTVVDVLVISPAAFLLGAIVGAVLATRLIVSRRGN